MGLITAMRENWCDLDVLLDPFTLYFPRRTESVMWYPGIASRSANLADPTLNQVEPTDLLEALDECNDVDPSRNHFCDTPDLHPSHQISRLPGKFFNVSQSAGAAQP